MTTVPTLDIGGTHVSAARVDTATWRALRGASHRIALRSSGTSEEIIATIAGCAAELGSMRGAVLAVAMPGPFDYDAGIGRFEDVAKFDALNGFDVRKALLNAIPEPPDDVVFVNDAAAFGIGEWVSGAARQARRAVAITLGTGVGSAFLDNGTVVDSGPAVPPDGCVHLLRIGDRPLEEVVSRRAIIAEYRARLAPDQRAHQVDVREIANRASDGEEPARQTMDSAFRALGEALSPWLRRFEAEVLVVGGGMTASWASVRPPLEAGIENVDELRSDLAVVRSQDPDESTAVGAAWHAYANHAGPTNGSRRA